MFDFVTSIWPGAQRAPASMPPDGGEGNRPTGRLPRARGCPVAFDRAGSDPLSRYPGGGLGRGPSGTACPQVST